jgi:osmotically-inducible protein OsmY
MFNRKWIAVVGTSTLFFGANVASAQVGVDTAGRAPGEIGAAADSAAGGARGSARGIGDAQVGVEVQAALSRELAMPRVRSDVRNGVATLNGTVATEADKQRAEQLARRIEGVTRVRNELVVEGAASGGQRFAPKERVPAASTDGTIASRLHADTRLAQRDIDVHERNDVITLTGEVQTVAEKETAGRIAAEAAPGAEVRNRLSVRSKN